VQADVPTASDIVERDRLVVFAVIAMREMVPNDGNVRNRCEARLRSSKGKDFLSARQGLGSARLSPPRGVTAMNAHSVPTVSHTTLAPPVPTRQTPDSYIGLSVQTSAPGSGSLASDRTTDNAEEPIRVVGFMTEWTRVAYQMDRKTFPCRSGIWLPSDYGTTR
jgi:hypothetical protein